VTSLETPARRHADLVPGADREVDELFRFLRERIFQAIATQQPVARDLRLLLGAQLVSIELARIGDYAAHIVRRVETLAGLCRGPVGPELAPMGELAVRQVHDVLGALREQNATRAREVAARDGELDRLYRGACDRLLAPKPNGAGVLRTVTLVSVAHTLERLGDRVVNIAEEVVFLDAGEILQLGPGSAASP
jgi:phosphate transport system protein